MNKFTIFVITLYIVAIIVAILLVFIDVKRQKKFIFNDINGIIEYRSKNPRCRYCKYLEMIKEKIPDVDSYGLWYGRYITVKHYRCKLKDKDIKLKNSFKGCLCDYFKLEDIKND